MAECRKTFRPNIEIKYMENYKENHKNRKSLKNQKPSCSELHDFPESGIHRHIFKLAMFLKNWRGEKLSPNEAVDLIKRKFYERPQSRDLKSSEVEDAVQNAFNSKCVNAPSSSKIYIPKKVMTSPQGIWSWNLPKLALEKESQDAVKEALRDYSWTVSKMIEDSPIDARHWPGHEVLGQLFDPMDLVCSGTLYKPQTRTLGESQKIGMSGDLFCPNPMQRQTGINKKGEVSQRCRDNAGRRKYLVYESDDKTLDFDAKACLIKCLWDKTGANLRMVVNSGGKSLHACFDASEDEEINWQFMSLAVKYGGDPDMYRPEQQSRLPNAFRRSKKTGRHLLDANGNKIRQECLYLDPK